jgi:hypothetical protein
LSAEEAYELLEALKLWAEEVEEGRPDPGWHAHFGSSGDAELTISIHLAEQPSPRDR